MPRVSIRELKNQTTEILREVRERRSQYVITYRGRPMAVILPVQEEWLEEETQRAAVKAFMAATANPDAEVLAELQALREEIGRSWQSDKTAVELVSDQRRTGMDR